MVPHYFNTVENIVLWSGRDGGGERDELITWYEARRSQVFHNKQVLEAFCQDDVTVLRQECRVFRREFLQFGNIEVFLESLTIASACNKVLRRKILKPYAIGLIPPGGYTCNNKYSKKANMWLLFMEQTDGVTIKHARNRRENRLPELLHFSLNGYCAETNKIYLFFGCYWYGCACQPFRDAITTNGDTLAARYEQTMARLEQISRAGYQVKIQWDCEYDNAGIATPELLEHRTVCKSPLCTWDALYGCRSVGMRIIYKAREGETMQYVDCVSISPYIFKYFKFPLGNPVNHVRDACKDREACLFK